MSPKLRENCGKLPILVLVIVAFLVVTLVGVGVVVFSKGKSDKSGHHEKAKTEHVMKLDEFVVNLADTDEPHYLKLEISLGLGQELGGKGGHGGGDSGATAIIRDSIINTASKYTYKQLLSDAGKARLKQDLMEALKNSPAKLDVMNVYFTNFAMQ